MKQTIVTILSILVIGATLCPIAASAQRQRAGGTTALDAIAREALIEVLSGAEGEYAARATYKAILAKFGDDVQPYANILLAEEKHVAALVQQCEKFGVPVPTDVYAGNVTAPATLLEAAEAGVLAEEANIDMYDALSSLVQKYPSLVQVFTNLRDASLYNHLPAFEAAVANGGSL